MAEINDPRSGEARTSDREVGAPRPSRTGSVPTLGFDDPSLRPLPPDKLDYHIPHPDAHPERHEHSDVPIRPLVLALLAIAVTCLFTFGLAYWLFWNYKGQQEALELKRTNVPAAKPAITGPRLQGVPGFSDKHPSEDLKDLRAEYEQELNGYGKPGADGFARVPIDRAMQIALDRGMFKTTQPTGGTGAAGSTPGGATGNAPAPAPRSPQREEGVR
jgi:hypothetical protein